MRIADNNTSQNLSGLSHYNPQEQVRDSKKVVVSPNTQDTISSMNSAQPFTIGKSNDTVTSLKTMTKTKASFWSKFLEFFGIGKSKSTEDKSEKSDESVSRPELEKPDSSDMALSDRFISDANNIFQQSNRLTKEIDDMLEKTPLLNDNDAYKLLIKCLIDQRKSLSEVADVTKNCITKMTEENRELEKQYMDGKSLYQKSKRTAQIASWVSTAINIATGIVGVAAWAVATLSTAGAAAIPAGLVIGEAFLGISGATSTITSAVLDHKNNIKKGDLIGMQEAREMKSSDIQELVTELNRQFEMIQSLWSQQRQILQNTHSLARMA